jgi:ribonuclease P protein component
VPKASNAPSNAAPDRSGKSRARFPRRLRLLRHADFERVYKSGRRHFSASLTAFYAPQQDELPKEGTSKPNRGLAQGLRVGFTVGRALGGAVQRNRMKRRLREAVRLSSPPVEVRVDVVINPKKSLLTTDFDAVLNEVRRAFVVIQKNSPEYGGPSTEDRKREGRSQKPRA